MNKNVLAVLIPFVAVAGLTIGFVWWDRGAPPGFNPTPHPVTVGEVTRDHRGVRIRGTAHFVVRINQTMTDGETYWLFPLMEPGDTLSREIKVLVRAQRSPDHLVSFEDLIVDGLARPPGRLVDPKARETFLDGGYDFLEGYVVVEAFHIEG